MSAALVIGAFLTSVVYAAVTGAWSVLLVTFPAMLIVFAMIGSESKPSTAPARHRRIVALPGLIWTAHGPRPFVAFRLRRRR